MIYCTDLYCFCIGRVPTVRSFVNLKFLSRAVTLFMHLQKLYIVCAFTFFAARCCIVHVFTCLPHAVTFVFLPRAVAPFVNLHSLPLAVALFVHLHFCYTFLFAYAVAFAFLPHAVALFVNLHFFLPLAVVLLMHLHFCYTLLHCLRIYMFMFTSRCFIVYKFVFCRTLLHCLRIYIFAARCCICIFAARCCICIFTARCCICIFTARCCIICEFTLLSLAVVLFMHLHFCYTLLHYLQIYMFMFDSRCLIVYKFVFYRTLLHCLRIYILPPAVAFAFLPHAANRFWHFRGMQNLRNKLDNFFL